VLDSSIYYANNAIKLNEKLTDSISTRQTILAYIYQGNNFQLKGLMDDSLGWFLKGVDLTKKYNETKYYFIMNFGIASFYTTSKEYEKALKLFEECLTYKEDPRFTNSCYINISNIYAFLNDIETSNLYLEKAKLNAFDSERFGQTSVLAINIGANYAEIGAYQKALDSYEEALEIANKIKNHKLGLEAKISMAYVLRKINKEEEAESILIKALDKAQQQNFLSLQKDIYVQLSAMSKERNDFSKALEYTNQYHYINDSINQLQKSEEIHKLEVEYRTVQKEKEIKLLQAENANRKLQLSNQQEAFKNFKLQQEIEQKENENQLLLSKNIAEKALNDNLILKKNEDLKDAQIKIKEAEVEKQKEFKKIIIYSFLIILIPVIALLITYYKKNQTQDKLNKKEKEINEEKISSLLKDQELNLVRASLEGQEKERKRIAQELHDSIGGNLAAIKLQLNDSLDHKNPKNLRAVNTQIDDTYDLVRTISHDLIPKKFADANFSNVLEEYFNTIGNASQLETSFNIYPRYAIDNLNENLQLETFNIIKELATNSLKYAKASLLNLELNLLENELSILFEDNGIGFDPHKKTEGIGFRNISNRLQKMNGELRVDSRKNRGTIINIRVNNLEPYPNEV